MQQFSTACPHDCFDQCAFLVTVDRGIILSLDPDSRQPVTGNTICSKGKKHLERINHPERLRYPLLRENGKFVRVSWDQAIRIMAGKLKETLEKYGPLGVLHFFDGGYSGLKKTIESRFFSALGGSTAHYGSLCWGAGLAAQKYDFGAVKAHSYHDLLHAKMVVIWGKNPADTALHHMSYLKKARENGTKIVLIDPLKTATAAVADQYLRIKPGTDGALALAMANVIIEKGFIDKTFIEQHSSGYDQFKALVKDYSPKDIADLVGIKPEVIEQLALDFASANPAAILIGIGLQRHSNGGNTVRAIDALAALTGNLGVAGGGASYANFRISPYLDHDFMSGEDLNPQRRYYPKGQLAQALSDFQDPIVAFIYNSRANPLVQVSGGDYLRRAFAKVPFKVTSEFFMTDTASACDLVLPATYFLEEDDLYFTSMGHQYLTFGPKVVEPLSECRSEYEIFKELAKLLELKNFVDMPENDLLARGIKPLTEATGIDLEKLKNEGPLLYPGGDNIPWAGRKFETCNGKYNFYSEAARAENGDGLPCYRKPIELSANRLHREGYQYWFATPHSRDSIHSTHRLPGYEKAPEAYISPQTASENELSEGEKIRVSSKRGSLEVRVSISKRIPPGTVMVYEGWWFASEAAVNNLTPDRLTDLGAQAAYYDCLCRIDKLKD
ncbi:MAG: molybdopterin-dependent oxidoreductase [Bacillota bacterium]